MLKQNSNYELFKNELIECPYCKNAVNIYYINQHNSRKTCKSFQTQLKKTLTNQEYKRLILEHKQNINKIKTELKLNLLE